MQINKNNRKDTMSKIRMNTELRNKLFNKIKDVFENEDIFYFVKEFVS